MNTINPFWSALRQSLLFDKHRIKNHKRHRNFNIFLKSYHHVINNLTKKEEILTGDEILNDNKRFKLDYLKEVQKEIDDNVPFGQTKSAMQQWVFIQKYIEKLPMKKTKQKTKTASVTTTPKIEMSKAIQELVESQTMIIESVLSGTVRIRAERWHGNTSVFNVHRILNFLNDGLVSGTINMKRYNALAKEIPTFFKVLGPNLVRAINASR
jgi:hypothetical protein